MDIALCHQNVDPARGGCETYIVDLARKLLADGNGVYLYASRWNPAALPSRLQVVPVFMPACPRFRRPWLFSAACRRALRGNEHHVTIGFDKTCGLDVLYPQGGLHRATIAHNHRIPHSRWKRGMARLRTWFDMGHWSFSRLEHKQYVRNKTGLVIANSRMVANHFQDYYGVSEARLRVVPNAIDARRLHSLHCADVRRQMRARWQIPNGTAAALFAAMNYPLKGLEPLLRALARVPERRPLVLLVAGNPRTAPFEELARRLGVEQRVRFIGFCADMRPAYFAADFLVHPTFYDPCSLVVLEALACGLPVITSEFNGARELLSGDEGFVIENPHHHDSLAHVLVKLTDPACRRACSEAAWQTARRWTFDHHYRRLTAVFAEVMEWRRVWAKLPLGQQRRAA
jgi:UDP-glucose:(heptosyl)LPS alpha-1,3-glucosyltransferase